MLKTDIRLIFTVSELENPKNGKRIFLKKNVVLFAVDCFGCVFHAILQKSLTVGFLSLSNSRLFGRTLKVIGLTSFDRTHKMQHGN